MSPRRYTSWLLLLPARAGVTEDKRWNIALNGLLWVQNNIPVSTDSGLTHKRRRSFSPPPWIINGTFCLMSNFWVVLYNEWTASFLSALSSAHFYELICPEKGMYIWRLLCLFVRSGCTELTQFLSFSSLPSSTWKPFPTSIHRLWPAVAVWREYWFYFSMSCMFKKQSICRKVSGLILTSFSFVVWKHPSLLLTKKLLSQPGDEQCLYSEKLNVDIMSSDSTSKRLIR